MIRTLPSCLITVALFLAAPAAAVEHHVLADGTGEYATIQDALDAAAPGDSVVLGNGLYIGARNRNLSFLGKNLTLRSAGGNPAACWLDCLDLERGLNLTQGETAAVVEGIMIEKGFGPWGGAVNLMNATATFRRCVFNLCSADDSFGAAIAGGVYALDSNVTFEDCDFTGNYFALRGTGAGLFAWEGSDVTAIRCNFIGNSAPGTSAGGTGGGIRVQDSKLTLVDCVVTGNSARIGAGISTGQLCIVDFRNTLVAGNADVTGSTASQAAGIQFGYDTDGTVESCTITRNRAARGAGISVANDCNLTITKSILWDNCLSGTEGEAAYILALGEVDFTCTDVDPAKVFGGIVSYTSSLAVDPWFCDPEPCQVDPTMAGTYTIHTSSPLADTLGCGLIGWGGTECGAVVDVPGWAVAATALALRCAPNPFREGAVLRYTTAAPGRVEVEIFDATGRVVARFDEGVREAGSYSVAWNGRTREGRPAPPGVYFARVRTGGQVAEDRLVRVE